MTLLEHLEELRQRLLRSIIALAVGFVLCWTFHQQIYQVLARPVKQLGRELAFFSITEPFLLYFKVSALAAVFLVSPYLLGEIWGYVAPGLYRREKRYAIPFILLGSFFFLAGGVFAYFVAFPYSIKFLLDMGEGMTPVLHVRAYLGFMMTMVLGLGLMFELPILIFLLSQIGVVTPAFLMRHFRWAVLIIFAVAAIVTPTPDVVTLCIFALPALLLYLLGVAAAALAQRGRRKAAARAA